MNEFIQDVLQKKDYVIKYDHYLDGKPLVSWALVPANNEGHAKHLFLKFCEGRFGKVEICKDDKGNEIIKPYIRK